MRRFGILPLLLMVHLASGQVWQKDHQRLSVLAGSQQSHLLDQQFSALAYQANEISFEISYQKRWSRHHAWGSLQAASGDLYPGRFRHRALYNTTEDLHGHTETDTVWLTGRTRTAVIALGYAYDLVHHPAFEIRIGGIVRNQLMYPSTFTNLGILNAASLMSHLELHWYPGQSHELYTGMSVPVVGYNTRFPYSGTVSRPNQSLLEAFFDGGTELVSLGSYQQINVAAGYRYRISDRTSLGVRYDFMYQYYARPVPLTTYAHRWGLMADFIF